MSDKNQDEQDEEVLNQELGPDFFERAVLTRPGEDIIEAINRAREKTSEKE